MEEQDGSVTGGGAAAPSAKTSEGGAQTSEAISPEVQALIEKAKAETREELVTAYEGSGGKLASYQSKADKKIAELERRLAEQQATSLKQVEAIFAQDPRRGGEAALEHLRQLQAQAAQASEAGKIRGFVETSIADAGLDLNDEDTASFAMTSYEALLAARAGEDKGAGAAVAFERDIVRRVGAKAKDAEKAWQKRFNELEKKLESTMETFMARASGAGIIDAGGPTGSTGDRTDGSAKSLKRKGLEEIKAERAALKPQR